MWIEPVAYLSEGKVCPCVKRVSVTSRLSCRVFNPHCGTSEHSAFGEIRLSDEFGLRLNFDLGHALFLIFYMNQIRNFSYYFLVKILFHHNISYHPIDKKIFKISFSALRGKKHLSSYRLLEWGGSDVTTGSVGFSGSFGASDPIDTSGCDVTSAPFSQYYGLIRGRGGRGWDLAKAEGRGKAW